VRRAPRPRALGFLLLVGAPGLIGTPVRSAGQSVADAVQAMRSGEYDDAEDTFRRVLREDATSVGARRGLVDILRTTGQYEDAEGVARAAPDPVPLANTLGEVLWLRGDRSEAERSFRQAIEGGADDRITAEINLAELMFEQGAVDQAMARFDAFIDIYNDSDGRLRAAELVAVGRAVRYLARDTWELFQDALKAFDEAINADPTWGEPSVRAGNLFLEKYSSPEAQAEFEKVLSRNPRDPEALLGLAKALAFDNAPDAGTVLNQLLELNENHVEARTMLARRHLTRDGHEAAREEIEKALAVNPNSLEALAVLAGSHLLEGDFGAFEETRQRVLAINPRHADMDATLAELSVQTRRYEQAATRARAAVELDPTHWVAWGLLGMNQLRLGQIEEGHQSIQTAFDGDPYNPWFKNNLDLLDTFDRFETRVTDHFELFVSGTEADLLATYLGPIAEEAFDSLSNRYRAEPDLPVRAELYPNSADFSVRTLGETGLGALGVSFGRVLVMDSPSARQRGDYNWASVFWHELAHTFHLGMTDNRVPRWFSEGLAVHEQRKARANWGHQPTIPFLRALLDGDLKKVSELDDGFMRPDFPQQVIFSYYQASLVFQVLEERYGFDTIRQMLHGYRDGRTTNEMFEAILEKPIEDFDDEFDDYLRDRFESPLRGVAQIGDPPSATAGIPELEQYVRSHPGELVGRIRLGALLLREGQLDKAEEHLQEALSIFPDYGGADSPLWFLAQLHQQRGETERAVAALHRLTELSESNYQALMMHAELLEELGRTQEAADALDNAVLIWPYEIDVHERLAAMHSDLGNVQDIVRERAAVVALDPVDRAEALYMLALAQRDAGDVGAARRSVLRSLDVAPNYEAALELLLELRGTTEAGR